MSAGGEWAGRGAGHVSRGRAVGGSVDSTAGGHSFFNAGGIHFIKRSASETAVKAAGVSVMSGKNYEQEFALEMAKAKEGKAKSTPWGSGYARAPEILHGAVAGAIACPSASPIRLPPRILEHACTRPWKSIGCCCCCRLHQEDQGQDSGGAARHAGGPQNRQVLQVIGAGEDV